MILDQAIKEVQQIAGWRSDKVAEITLALQYAQDEREKPGNDFPWWLRKEAIAFTTVANTPKYNIPSDYIQDTEEKEGNVFIYTISGQTNSRTVFLSKLSFENAQVRYFGEWPYIYSLPNGAALDQTSTIQPGMPTAYYLGNTYVLLYTVPNAAYQVWWRYWGKDSAQAIGQENNWLKYAPWSIIGDAAKKICSDLQYAAGVAAAQEIISRSDGDLLRSIVGREEAGKRRAMGSRL